MVYKKKYMLLIYKIIKQSKEAVSPEAKWKMAGGNLKYSGQEKPSSKVIFE